MPTIINADSVTGGAVVTADASGVLELQAGGTTALTITGANVTFATTPVITGGADVVTTTGTQTLTNKTIAFGSNTFTGALGVANGGTGVTSLTANNVVLGNGTSAVQFVAPGSAGNVLTSNGTTWASAALSVGAITATASGSISDGAPLIMNSNGTVTAAAGANASSGSGVTFGFSGTTSYYPTNMSSVYSPQGLRTVVFYIRNSETTLYANVATISGSSVSFGGDVSVASSPYLTQGNYTTYDSVSQRVAVFYGLSSDNSVRGRTGTISGGSITFGSEGVIAGSNGQPWGVSVTYDVASQRFLVPYFDSSFNTTTVVLVTLSGTTPAAVGSASLPAGTYGTASVYDAGAQRTVIFYGSGSTSRATVCTISGNSLTLNTPVTFSSSATYNSMNAVYHQDAQKIVLVYAESGVVTARVGTVSGTTISFGTAVTIANGSLPSISYDSVAKKVVVVYTTGGVNSAFTVGTVSGTDISFTTPANYGGPVGSLTTTTTAYDANSLRTLLSFGALVTGSFVYGESRAYRVPFTNVTATNFVGFSSGAYTNGQTATVQIIGAVDDAQTGLTPGSGYYLQNDGTLATTAGSPSIYAGTAISSSRIIVKG